LKNNAVSSAAELAFSANIESRATSDLNFMMT
jgi:hypothetical protein